MSDLSLLEAQLKVIREGLEEMVERLRSLEGAIQKQDGEWDPSRIKWVKLRVLGVLMRGLILRLQRIIKTCLRI